MPDEVGTEATRSDAPSADESLFGEVADDTEAVVADEQDANEKSDREEQAPDDAEEQAVGDETGSSEDLKSSCPSREAGPPSACSGRRRTRTSRPSTTETCLG